ncbi:MAG: acetoacetate decarboxylase family protein, partial [Chloroflexaceae bacterium]|nr:acetoacetate decarboxylase family protein [Chloroflexaceae bacterium]
AGTFVRYGSRFGLYVSHIGVDNDVSQRAGRELWYLPKHRWHFEWQHDELATSVRVWDGSRLVCAISDAPVKAAFWPLRTSVTFLNLRGTDVATITGKFNLGVAAIPWQFQPGPDGPLTLFKPIGRVFTFALKGTAEVQSLQVLDAGATNA